MHQALIDEGILGVILALRLLLLLVDVTVLLLLHEFSFTIQPINRNHQLNFWPP